MIVANSPSQGKNYNKDSPIHRLVQIPYRKIMMEAKLTGIEPYSIAIETPISTRIQNATLITESLTFHQINNCVWGDKYTILYFNDNIDIDYWELEKCIGSTDPKITIFVISWIKEGELYHIEPPSWHCRYIVDKQREFYINDIRDDETL